jgi:hypothetical protein
MDGEKDIAIISDAESIGVSLHVSYLLDLLLNEFFFTRSFILFSLIDVP